MYKDYTTRIDDLRDGLKRMLDGLTEHRNEMWIAIDALPERIGEHARLKDYRSAIIRECAALKDSLWKFRVDIESEIAKSLEAHECVSTVLPVPMAPEEFRMVWTLYGDDSEMPGHGYFCGLWWPEDYTQRTLICNMLDALDAMELRP